MCLLTSPNDRFNWVHPCILCLWLYNYVVLPFTYNRPWRVDSNLIRHIFSSFTCCKQTLTVINRGHFFLWHLLLSCQLNYVLHVSNLIQVPHFNSLDLSLHINFKSSNILFQHFNSNALEFIWKCFKLDIVGLFNQVSLHVSIFFFEVLLQVGFVRKVYVNSFDVLHEVWLFGLFSRLYNLLFFDHYCATVLVERNLFAFFLLLNNSACLSGILDVFNNRSFTIISPL